MLIYLLTFLSGATVDGIAVFWVHFSVRGETVHNWHLAPAFILGYGTGSALAVFLKRLRATKSTPTAPSSTK